ncbi:hypothetical protein DERF_007658 [Dermatophagoides farinae]|uniref:Uncharacterized protein n=1 Tax=Dermatophagoides farinae TaxID=6954 RepID=A0A922I1R6_DERFA|nr:hypothetical protein DERF_007658 [Dermatophagoides farinae]
MKLQLVQFIVQSKPEILVLSAPLAVGLALLKVSMKIGSALDATRFHSCATLEEMNEVPAPSSNTTRIFRPLIVVVNVL